ncbi:hypothetical protein Tco_0139094 [Tanacetum coccineum]
MNTTQAQQKALDDALFAPTDRLEFGKCNMRLKTDIKPKEATFQVVLDALALTPFYQAFMITAEVPTIYMQEFWATITICPKVPGHQFEEPPLEHDILSFLRDLGNSRYIHYITDGRYNNKNIDYVYLLWEDFLFQSTSRRNKMFWHTARDDIMFTSMRCVSRHENTQVYGTILPQHLTNQAMLKSIAYQTYYAYVTGEKSPNENYVQKKAESDTSPKKTSPASKGSRLKSSAKVAKTNKKKQPATMPKTKGLAVLSEVALTKAEQIKLDTKRSKKDFHLSHESGLGDGVDIQSKVPDEQQRKTVSQDDEDDVEESDLKDDSAETESDNDRDDLTHPNLSDAEMTNAQGNQDTDDTHVTLTTVPLVVQLQSYFISSDLVSKFINPSPDTVSVTAETPSSDTTIPPPPIPIIQPLQQTPESTTTTTILTMTLPNILNFASLFQFDQRVSTLETEMSEFKQTNQFAKVVSLNSGIIDNYLTFKMKETVDSTMKAIIKEHVQAQVSKIMPKIEKYVTESLEAEVLIRSTNQPQTSYAVIASLSEFELKKILIDKIETNKSIDMLDIQKDLYKASDEDPSVGSNRGSKRRRPVKEVELSKEPIHKESKSISSSKGATRSQPKSTRKSAHAEEHEALDDDESQWNPLRSPTPDREWHKTKTVDNRPPQPWIRQIDQASSTQSSFNEFLDTLIDFSAFIMNRLITDNLAQEVLTGWRSSQKYTTSITKTKAADYGQVKWIEDKDDQLYKFREGNFKRLRRHDIEDMLLLLFQDNLTNLNLEERYQKKINLTRPESYHLDLRRMTSYTAYPDIQGIIYEDEMNRNCLMRTDKLYKFSDGTLNHVRTALNDIATGIKMNYLPQRKWNKQENQRARMMINAIDKKLKDRRLMRNLEKFVSGRPYEGDLRLLERII